MGGLLGGGKGYVAPPPSQIIGGPGPPAPTPSSYAYGIVTLECHTTYNYGAKYLNARCWFCHFGQVTWPTIVVSETDRH